MRTRIYKFRGWDTERKIMFENIGFTNSDCGQSWQRETYMVDDNKNLALHRVIPMQFTGLLDKNGKEIYEGDIIETETSTGSHRFAVEYDVFSTSFMCPDKVDDEVSTTLGQLPNFVEVIGNIHQNPELLK